MPTTPLASIRSPGAPRPLQPALGLRARGAADHLGGGRHAQRRRVATDLLADAADVGKALGQPWPAPLLNSSANRAAARGVRRGPVPPMTISGPRSLHELREVRALVQLPEAPLEAERLTRRRRPQAGHDLQRLLEAVEALAHRRERDPERLVLALVPAGPDPRMMRPSLIWSTDATAIASTAGVR